jgi:hexosaminidase
VFHYAKGSGLPINSIALLEDGKEVARDGHAGYAARNPSKPVYILNLPTVKENAKYTLQASLGKADSFGTVTLLFEPKKQ